MKQLEPICLHSAFHLTCVTQTRDRYLSDSHAIFEHIPPAFDTIYDTPNPPAILVRRRVPGLFAAGKNRTNQLPTISRGTCY